MVEGKRSRGKPKNRWRDNILAWSYVKSWSEMNTLAKDRNKWKALSHVSSQSACGGISDT
jgi:hypothetical protein